MSSAKWYVLLVDDWFWRSTIHSTGDCHNLWCGSLPSNQDHRTLKSFEYCLSCIATRRASWRNGNSYYTLKVGGIVRATVDNSMLPLYIVCHHPLLWLDARGQGGFRMIVGGDDTYVYTYIRTYICIYTHVHIYIYILDMLYAYTCIILYYPLLTI